MDHHRQLPSGLGHLQQPGGSMDKAPPDPVVPHLGELWAGVAVIPEAGGEVFQKEIKWKGLVRETGKENREGKKKKAGAGGRSLPRSVSRAPPLLVLVCRAPKRRQRRQEELLRRARVTHGWKTPCSQAGLDILHGTGSNFLSPRLNFLSPSVCPSCSVPILGLCSCPSPWWPSPGVPRAAARRWPRGPRCCPGRVPSTPTALWGMK